MRLWTLFFLSLLSLRGRGETTRTRTGFAFSRIYQDSGDLAVREGMGIMKGTRRVEKRPWDCFYHLFIVRSLWFYGRNIFEVVFVPVRLSNYENCSREFLGGLWGPFWLGPYDQVLFAGFDKPHSSLSTSYGYLVGHLKRRKWDKFAQGWVANGVEFLLILPHFPFGLIIPKVDWNLSTSDSFKAVEKCFGGVW